MHHQVYLKVKQMPLNHHHIIYHLILCHKIFITSSFIIIIIEMKNQKYSIIHEEKVKTFHVSL